MNGNQIKQYTIAVNTVDSQMSHVTKAMERYRSALTGRHDLPGLRIDLLRAMSNLRADMLDETQQAIALADADLDPEWIHGA